jgi:N-acetylglucosaminyl-diphospho-decaprenol L-rhamnosyltransferase
MTGAVAAVVVTADTRDMTTACVRSLLEQVADVIVVDNASSDGTAEALRSLDERVRVVALLHPVGFASACNLGLREEETENVLFINSDVFPAPGAVGRLMEELSTRPDAVAAGGRLVDPGSERTQEQYRPRTFPTVRSLAVQLTGLARLWPGNPITRRHLGGHLDEQGTAEVDQPAGACLLVRRSAFEEIGGFDEGFWFWYEDVDLARRLQRSGTILYVPTAVFEHHGGASFARWSKAQVVRSRHYGLLRYIERHFGTFRRACVALILMPVLTVRRLLVRGEARDAYREVQAATWDLLRTGGRGASSRALRSSLLGDPDSRA